MSQFQHVTGLVSRIQSGEISWVTYAGVMAAGLLGIFMVLGTGLVGADVIHNTAHDVRHGLSFPCH